jgi:Restriction endonuclease EcoRII, N-terminal
MADSEEERQWVPPEVMRTSPFAERAVTDARESGISLLKFLSPNDVGLTGSHQCGIYLPKPATKLFDPDGPQRGRNKDIPVKIEWPDGSVTDSRIKYWGKKTRNEYHLTRFGRDFSFLREDDVGSLLVLTPIAEHEFRAHILAHADDIDHVIDSLGMDLPYDWGGLFGVAAEQREAPDACVARLFKKFAERCSEFPSGRDIATHVWRVVSECSCKTLTGSTDKQLLCLHDREYELFSLIEEHIYNEQYASKRFALDSFL